MALPIKTEHISTDDHFMVVQDGCIKMVSFWEFVEQFDSCGDCTDCNKVIDCFRDIGVFGESDEGDINSHHYHASDCGCTCRGCEDVLACWENLGEFHI